VKNKEKLTIGGENIALGETKDIDLKVSETYSGTPVDLLIRVIRAPDPGPTVFICGAVHGDELNGMGIVREVMLSDFTLLKGTLICIPVVNIFGFENHSRYLPDRRDLNRSFPGSKSGSLATRLAYAFFNEVVRQCDYGIDLHTAATRRTNFPQIRADLDVPNLKKFSESFGCELIINKTAHENSLRAAACQSKCATILFEAGEVLKLEPGVVELGVRGVHNVLKWLSMLKGDLVRPSYQTVVNKSTVWIRSNFGGVLHFHVHPGNLIEKGVEIATCKKLFSEEAHKITSPVDGIVIGMTTLPAIKPGEPICHIATPDLVLSEIKKKIEGGPRTLHRRVQKELSTHITVTDPE
jgi:uncharacterized protein